MDGEGALHAGVLVAGDRTRHLVAAGLDTDLERRGLAAVHDVGAADLPSGLAELQVVLQRTSVRDCDRRPLLGRNRRGRELLKSSDIETSATVSAGFSALLEDCEGVP